MNDDRILAAARKAARRMARATGTSYQTCLDDIARQRGRDHWGAFLADPAEGVTKSDATVADAAGEGPDAGPQAAVDGHRDDTAGPVPVDGDAEHHQHIEARASAARRSFASRLARLFGGTERGIVKRSVERHLIATGRDAGMLLGWSAGDGRRLVLGETVPVAAFAPPGSGKTASVVIPAIVTSDRHCLVVHDETDLARMTSGYRATLGPVTVLDLGGGGTTGGLDPLSSSWLPVLPDVRRSYLAALAAALSPESKRLAEMIAVTIDGIAGEEGGTSFAAVAERLEVLETIDARDAAALISPLLDPATRRCMASDDFRPRHLRGMRDGPEGPRPTTLYIVRSSAGNARQGRVAAVIQAAVWWWAQTVAPGERSPDGDVHGPFPVTVVLEDAHRLPPMPALASVIERGRARKLGHVVTAPTMRALARIAGRDVDDLEALFAVQIVLPQNDADTIAHLERRVSGVSRDEIVGTRAAAGLLVLQYEAEALRVRSPMFFLHPDLLRRVHNPRTGKGPAPVAPAEGRRPTAALPA